MTLESLLLSRDIEVVRVLRPTLEKLSIQVEICHEAKQARAILDAGKFDAVIIDCDEVQGGIELLQGVRTTLSNKNSVTFAVLNGKQTTTQQAFGMGVNFVLQKPISNLNASRCFNAALSFMERERRRYQRQPVEMMVRGVTDEKEWKATSTNISEGGMAIVSQETLPTNGKSRLQFTLPESTAVLELESEIAWANAKGQAGLRFVNVPQDSQQYLENWLNLHMERQVSGSTNEPDDPGSKTIH
jgi:CheY-like chemotaxis protein